MNDLELCALNEEELLDINGGGVLWLLLLAGGAFLLGVYNGSKDTDRMY